MLLILHGMSHQVRFSVPRNGVTLMASLMWKIYIWIIQPRVLIHNLEYEPPTVITSFFLLTHYQSIIIVQVHYLVSSFITSYLKKRSSEGFFIFYIYLDCSSVDDSMPKVVCKPQNINLFIYISHSFHLLFIRWI